ncbi:MAG: hypothetical protein K2N85_12560, partial [Lachnospiraceae bacterium]|nr:hypothetical protein [Lachnospiraceae bacterium]
MKLKAGITSVILMILISSLFALQVNASDGEPMEESQPPLFDGFAEMDYCLFLETNLDYGVTLDYYRYGIYGNFVQTMQEGEAVYFALNEKLIGNKLALCTHTEWYENEEPFIQDISPDLEWTISRQKEVPNTAIHTDRLYYQGQELEKKDGMELDEIALFAMQRIEGGETYEQMGEEKIKKWEKIIQTARGWKA